MSLSATTNSLLDRLKAHCEAIAASGRTDESTSEVAQYDVTVDGQIARTMVFDMKNYAVGDQPADNADIVITIEEQHLLAMFMQQLQLVDLHAEGKIAVKGDVSLLAVLDARGKRNADAATKAAKEAAGL